MIFFHVGKKIIWTIAKYKYFRTKIEPSTEDETVRPSISDKNVRENDKKDGQCRERNRKDDREKER